MGNVESKCRSVILSPSTTSSDWIGKRRGEIMKYIIERTERSLRIPKRMKGEIDHDDSTFSWTEFYFISNPLDRSKHDHLVLNLFEPVAAFVHAYLRLNLRVNVSDLREMNEHARKIRDLIHSKAVNQTFNPNGKYVRW